MYVSFSSPGGGTIQTSDNVVWTSLPGGGNRGEVCHLQLHVINWWINY